MPAAYRAEERLTSARGHWRPLDNEEKAPGGAPQYGFPPGRTHIFNKLAEADSKQRMFGSPSRLPRSSTKLSLNSGIKSPPRYSGRGLETHSARLLEHYILWVKLSSPLDDVPGSQFEPCACHPLRPSPATDRFPNRELPWFGYLTAVVPASDLRRRFISTDVPPQRRRRCSGPMKV